MKKLIIFTLALSLILASAAFASQTRVLTMGDNNRILVDDANIWMFPSRLNDYPGLAIGEFDNGDDFTRFGVHWQFGDDDPWVLATYLENNFTYFPYWGLPFSPPFSNGENRRGNFFYARNMGANKFGIRATAYWSANEFTDNNTPTPSQNKETFRYYEFSLGLTDANNTWDVAVTGGFGSWTEEEDGLMLSEPDGLLDFMVMGRMFWNSGPNYQYVPHASIEFHNAGFNFFDGGTPNVIDENFKLTAFIFDLGIGQVYTPSANVEAVLDVGLRFERNKNEFTEVVVALPDGSYEDKWNYTTIPYWKLGLDAEVFSWLDVRFGATSFWNIYKEEYSEPGAAIPNFEDYKQQYAQNNTYLGFGFHWGNFHVDTYTDPEIFLDGFDFISGDGNTEMNFQISATYDLM